MTDPDARPAANPATNSVMLLLRDGTADAHKAAETQPFQKALVKGEISRDAYAAYLQQMLLIHAALEQRLANCPDAALRRVVRGEQFQSANLRADLAFLGADVNPQPLPAAAQLVERINGSASAEELLGLLYVLEGSKNGAAYIARAVRRALSLAPGSGDRYLDPHGEQQRAVWSDFKTRMDAEPWASAQQERMLASARVMFDGIEKVSQDLESLREPNVHIRPAGAPAAT